MSQQNTPPEQNHTVSQPSLPWEGLGVGIFAIIAGALLIAERVGWIAKDVAWGWPLVVLVFGVVTVSSAIRKK